MPGVQGIAGARVAGLATGAAVLAAVALTQWSVAPSRAPLGLDVKLTAVTHGELDVEPAGPALLQRAVRPGHDGFGAVYVRNVTSARLAVRPRLLDGPEAVDRALWLELTVSPGGRRVFHGPAGALRRGAAPVVLASGERATIAVRASVPPAGERVARGRAGEWRMAFATEVLR